MGSVQAWAAGLCVAALGCTLLQMLAPQAAGGKLFRLIVAAFFVCAVIAPLLSVTAQLPLDWDYSPAGAERRLQERFERQITEQVDAVLSDVVDEVLTNYHMAARSVEAETETTEDGGLSVARVIVYVDRDSTVSPLVVKQIVERRLEIETVVKYDE